MSKQTKWDNFTDEELKEILIKSNRFKEIQEAVGYKYHTNRNSYIKQLAEKFGINIEHYSNYGLKIGEKFNLLTVLEKDELKSKEKGRHFWKCCCNCGTIITTNSTMLLQGNKKSCGCLHSAGNYQISKLLQSLNLNYQAEFSFEDLKDKGKLRFDFGIFKNNELQYLIEYNGMQHYYSIDFFGGEETLQSQQRKDELKRKYCQEHNIPLIVFMYCDTVNEANLKQKLKEVDIND